MNIGFIGLGNMGSAIAGRLLKANHTVRVWNRSPANAQKLAAQGAQAAETPDEAFKGDAVFSMLGDDDALRAVLLDSGVLGRASGGALRVHINMATISVAFADELAARHAERGIAYISAPVLGRPDAAAAGKLNIVAAGPASALETVQPLLDVVGQKTWRFGEIASRANVVKLTMNFMLAAAIESMGEAAALATGYEIKAGDILELASQTLFPGPVYQGYGRLIAASAYEPAGFKARLGLKDVRLALAAAEAATTPMPLASQIRDTMLEALARGEGEKEFGVVLGRAAMRRAGR
ncbi:MAG: 3-hydroxyisobutyrate dehydrogenase and related beta-hydroxyacid dehydrogenase [Gammaproteobacteria bacterium]|nr:3-hydroxyisobutyrate dehydrogenase and related beta-hydroxyacid dehydrogenase [Gammaproteobacteria bacterium]